MSTFPAFIDLKKLTEKQILRLFSLAQQIEKTDQMEELKVAPVALLFFEPSTRTRFSFEMSCGRLGLRSILLSGKAGTSLEKGETLEDTILNIAAMKPSLIVTRADDELAMPAIASTLRIPWINAGWGKRGHPTQALLDALTMQKFLGRLHDKKVLFIGDVRHSRVVASHLELSRILNYQVGVCGPSEFLFSHRTEENAHAKIFKTREEGLKWADVVVALRVQNERHEKQHQLNQYNSEWGLNEKSLTALAAQSLILHPGPINQGVEMTSQALKDSRCHVLEQVTQGVFLRQALIKTLLQEPGDLS